MEFLQAVKSNTSSALPYAPLLDALDADFVVDVISGTSAGGVNGAFLARALATGGDLTHMSKLWRELGDFSALADWGKEAPTSLLNGRYFHTKLEEALGRISGPRVPLVRTLDLFLTATDIAGRYWQRHDFLESSILGRQHTKYFQLKFRPAARDLAPDERHLGYDQEQNDFCGDSGEQTDGQKIAHLAKLARTTAAFPAMFDPVDWSVAEAYSGEPGLTADERSHVWMADGGMLDNAPFTPALKTIFNRAATRMVDRLVFYVEPDPTDNAVPTDPRRSQQPNALQVAWAALDLRLYQGIDQNLRAIEEHNRTARHVETMVDVVAKRLADELQDYDSHVRSSAFAAYMTLRSTQLAVEVRAELVRAYLDYQAKNPARAPLPPEEALKWLPDAGDGAYWEAFRKRGDTPFLKRRLHFLIEQIGRVRRRAADSGCRLADLVALERRLWPLLQLLRQAEWRLWKGKLATPDGRTLYSLFESGCEGKPAEWLMSAAEQMVQEFYTAYKADSPRRQIEALGFKRHWYNFEAFDILLYPLSIGSSLGERATVEWVRVSPYDAATLLRPNPMHPYTPSGTERMRYGKNKMAGDTFFHFGGFLSHRWRANDFMWGRLDAADQIISSLVAAAEKAVKEEQRFDAARLQVIREVAQKARLEAFRQILLEELEPEGLEKLAAYAHRRSLEVWELTRSVREAAAGRDAIRVVRSLARIRQYLSDRGDTRAAESLAQMEQNLRDAAPALSPDTQAGLEAFMQGLGSDLSAGFMAADPAMLGPLPDRPLDETLSPAYSQAWQRWLITRYATWEDLRSYLLNDHVTGMETAASLHPAVLANTAVDMADNARRVMGAILGEKQLKLPWLVERGLAVLGDLFRRLRRGVKLFLPRPAPGADDRRPPLQYWAPGLVAASLLMLGWGGLRHLYGLLRVGFAWTAGHWLGIGVTLAALALLRLFFPRKLAGLSRILPLGGVSTLFGILLVFLVGDSAQLAAWSAGLKVWGFDLGLWHGKIPAIVPVLLFGVAAYDFLLLLSRWLTRALAALPEPQPARTQELIAVRTAGGTCGAPEGILFDGAGRLVVATLGGCVLRREGRQWSQIGQRLPGMALGITADPLGGYLLAGAGKVWRWTEGDAAWTPLANVPTANGVAATSGGDVFVSAEFRNVVWRLRREPDNPAVAVAKEKVGRFMTPNGLAVDPREDTLYMVEMLTGRVLAIPLQGPGKPRVLARLGEFALTDGVVVLPDGDLAVSTNRGDLFRIDPQSGKVKQWLQLPGHLAAANLAVRGRSVWFAGLGSWFDGKRKRLGFRGEHVGSFEFPPQT